MNLKNSQYAMLPTPPIGAPSSSSCAVCMHRFAFVLPEVSYLTGFLSALLALEHMPLSLCTISACRLITTLCKCTLRTWNRPFALEPCLLFAFPHLHPPGTTLSTHYKHDTNNSRFLVATNIQTHAHTYILNQSYFYPLKPLHHDKSDMLSCGKKMAPLFFLYQDFSLH